MASQTLMERLQERKPGISFDQNTVFTHGSEHYFIDGNITIAEEGTTFPIDGTDIVEFVWENTVNNLFISGHITVRDATGRLGIINNSLFSHVTIFFCKVEPIVVNGKTVDYKFDKDNKFTHSFLVNNVELEDREKNEVDYTLELVSDTFFATKRLLYWSNYSKLSPDGTRDKENFNPFKILKQLFLMAYADMETNFNLACKDPGIDPTGFDIAANSCNLLIDYATNTRTTIVEAIDYLLNKTFYTKDGDNDKSLRMIVYDAYNKKYKLLDFKDAKTFVETNYQGMWIALMGTPIEELTVPKKQNYSSLNLISNMEFVDTFLRYTWIRWNQGMEDFTGGNRKDYMSTKTTQDIADYVKPGSNLMPKTNKFRLDNGMKERKVFDTIFNTPIPGYEFDVDYNKVDTTWNTTYSVYLDLIYNTLYKDALVFNTNGKIRHNPGTLMILKVDDVEKKLDSDVQTTNKHPHGGISDIFFVVKTTHIVHPNEGSSEKFTENLVISKWWEFTE